MKTIVQGKKISRYFEVWEWKGIDGVPYRRPEVCDNYSKQKIEWETILEYEGTPQSLYGRFYISETEKVYITDEIFRADLGNWVLHTDKVLSDKSFGKAKAEKELVEALKEYNKYKIESKDYLKKYCDIHKLSYEDTDYDELLEIVPKPKDESMFKYKPINEFKSIDILRNVSTNPWENPWC